MEQWNKTSPPEICIVGAGFSGICAGIKLQSELDVESFTIFDENHEVGGTWLVNSYPGCGCDVASHLYSFSFEPNPYWSKVYSGREEIWEYLRTVAKKYELYKKIKFNHKVTSMEWDDTIQKWQVTIVDQVDGKEFRRLFDILVCGIGALRIPHYPEEFKAFSGETMHSAEWNDSIELKEKTVAIVGSGASAVQIIPEIVGKVKRLIVYQRKAAWIVPRIQVDFPEGVKWAFANVPGAQWILRNLIFWTNEMSHSAFKRDTVLSKLAVKFGKFHLKRQIRDPELREKLTPNYNFGCKRVAPSNEYYPALARPNVRVITSKITEVTKNSLVNEDGTVEKPDVLILATGYKVQDFFAPLIIRGKGGENVLQKWKEFGPNAYAGIVSSTTPNLFFLLGPNTALGHSSVIVCIECQVHFMIEAIRGMMKRKAQTITVSKSAEDEYMTKLHKTMESTVWGSTNCGSWYANSKGVNTTLWPKNLVAYYNLTKTVNFSHFEFS